MNALSWIIYFGDRADGISNLMSFAAAITFLVSAVMVITYLVNAHRASTSESWAFDDIGDLDEEKVRKNVDEIVDSNRRAKMWSIKGALTFLFFVFLAVAIPNERAIYMMAGSEIGEEIVKSDEVSEVGDKVYRLLNLKLDEYLEDEPVGRSESEPSKVEPKEE